MVHQYYRCCTDAKREASVAGLEEIKIVTAVITKNTYAKSEKANFTG